MPVENNPALNVLLFPEKLDADYKFPNSNIHWTKEFTIDCGQSNINALYFENKKTENLIIYFQGNSGSLNKWLNTSISIADLEHNLLVYDYRGFGKSTPAVGDENEFYSDGQAVLDFAIELGYAHENIILFGYSLGTGIATKLTLDNPKIKSLILESPYQQLPGLSWLPASFKEYTFDNLSKIKNVKVPTLIMHGKEDDDIPISHSEELYRNLNSRKKRLKIFESGKHGDLRYIPEYKSTILDFLKSD
jgi:pimeloyl-ACP methyl ester carboxylesterase